MTEPSLEVRIPIGDEPSMWVRCAYIAKAVRMQVPDAHVRVTVGSPSNSNDGKTLMLPILGQDLEVHFLPRAEYMHWYNSNNPHAATIMERFKPPFKSEHVLFLDADVFPIGDITELLRSDPVDWSLAAMIAHAPPFGYGSWGNLGVDKEWFRYKYSALGLMTSELWAPPYFNTGVVYAKRRYLEAIWPEFASAAAEVSHRINSYFVDQLALTLAMIRTMPWQEPIILTQRWNFPNQSDFDTNFKDELADVRFIHFLRQNQVHREADFLTHSTVRNFILRSDLQGSNEVLRKAVARVYHEIDIERHLTKDSKLAV